MIIGKRHFDFSKKIYIMGILNVSPDSFSDGGFYSDPDRALDRALQMQEEGADIIDVGGESTRPGADPVPFSEELRRVLPVLKKIMPRLKIPVSIDTQKSKVAKQALENGVGLVNDVSALRDPEMGPLLASYGIPLILMHMKGVPQTMQDQVSYGDVLAEIMLFFGDRLSYCHSLGILPDRILIDPGIGFGKRHEDNLKIFSNLSEFRKLEKPLVIGTSRKSFIRKIFGEVDIVLGSVVSAAIAAERGVSLLRVHDVAETKKAIGGIKIL